MLDVLIPCSTNSEANLFTGRSIRGKSPTVCLRRANISIHRKALESSLGVSFTTGNEIEILQNSDEIFPAILQAIESAQRDINFETFVYRHGDIPRVFAESLARKASEGISVRVLLDAFGARIIPKELLDHMSQSGVQIRWFRPLSTWRFWRSDKRTHRKILIVDGREGFTGGVGIADEWLGNAQSPEHWRETHLRLVGPAIRGLSAAFFQNWNESGSWDSPAESIDDSPNDEGDFVQFVRASSTVGWTDMATLMHTLVSNSQRSLRIVTAYFVPDPRLISLLVEAATRGVDTQILVPGQYYDSRLFQLAGHVSFDCLLEAGVQIWQYQRTMLHVKVVVVDEMVSCVGSTNLNHRSLSKDEACCAVVLSPRVGKQLFETFSEDSKHAQRLTLAEWRKRGTGLRFQEYLARILAQQL